MEQRTAKDSQYITMQEQPMTCVWKMYTRIQRCTTRRKCWRRRHPLSTWPVWHSLISLKGQLCTFAWVLSLFVQVFSLLLTKKTTIFTVLCRHAHSDWQSTEAFLYVIRKSNIMQTLSLTLKTKHNFKHFYYIHIVEIPTQKGEYSWKYTELSLKWKEWIVDRCECIEDLK